MLRASLSLIVLLLLGCAAPKSPPVAPPVGGAPASKTSVDFTPLVSDGRIQIAPEHRSCQTNEDCTGVYATCGNCNGDCSGVNKSFEVVYARAQREMCHSPGVCDYDCHPRAGLEKASCVQGLCRMSNEP